MYVWRLQKPRSSITLAAKPHRRNHRRYPLRRTGNPWPVEPETRREYRSSANPATPTVANAGSLTVANVWPAGGYRFAAATTLWGATIRSARRLACSKRGPVESDHALGSHDPFRASPRVFQARAGGKRPRSGEPRSVPPVASRVPSAGRWKATTLWGVTTRSARRLACSKRGPVESDHALGSHDPFRPPLNRLQRQHRRVVSAQNPTTSDHIATAKIKAVCSPAVALIASRSLRTGSLLKKGGVRPAYQRGHHPPPPLGTTEHDSGEGRGTIRLGPIGSLGSQACPGLATPEWSCSGGPRRLPSSHPSAVSRTLVWQRVQLRFARRSSLQERQT